MNEFVVCKKYRGEMMYVGVYAPWPPGLRGVDLARRFPSQQAASEYLTCMQRPADADTDPYAVREILPDGRLLAAEG
jgi:hypothetical protein